MIFDLYDKLYKKFIEVKKENEHLRRENYRLKRGGGSLPQYDNAYSSQPFNELRSINEVETESNEENIHNKTLSQVRQSSEISKRMKTYSVEKLRDNTESENRLERFKHKSKSLKTRLNPQNQTNSVRTPPTLNFGQDLNKE